MCIFTFFTGQQNLTFWRGRKLSVPNITFNAEFKYLSSFSPSPSFFVTAKLNVQYWSATLYECLAP
jgi:hypothetical protein